MMKSKKKEIIITLLYLAIYLVVALTVAILQPLSDTPPLYGNPPDEHSRYLIPLYICNHGIIPTGFEEEVRIPYYGFSYGFYNTFPYIIMGYTMWIVKHFTSSALALLYTARFVNVFFGLVMAIIVRKIAKKVFNNEVFGWLFSVAVTFLPQALFMHTYVNTDSMALLSTALMVYGLVCMYKDKISIKSSACIVLGVIFCALSYYNCYGYILITVILCIAYFAKEKSYDFKNMFKWGIPITACILIGISWWFIRAYILYDGDIIGFKTRDAMAYLYGAKGLDPNAVFSARDRGYTLSGMIFSEGFLSNMFYSFVAVYGSMSILITLWFYRAYALFYGVGILFAIIYACRNIKGSSFRKIFFHANMIFCTMLPFILLIYYAYASDFQFQGRYLLPMVVPFMYYVVKGLEYLLSLCTFIPQKLMNTFVICTSVALSLALLLYVYKAAVPVYQAIGHVL